MVNESFIRSMQIYREYVMYYTSLYLLYKAFSWYCYLFFILRR